MRLTTVILFMSMMQVYALTTFGQRVTLNEKNSSLKSVLRKIRNQTGYDFIFDRKLMDRVGPVKINVTDVTLEEALNGLFTTKGLSYQMDGKLIVVTASPAKTLKTGPIRQQQIDVRGRVVNQYGHPLQGATISVATITSTENEETGDFSMTAKGKKAATMTNANGEFSLQGIPNQAYIAVSYIGYQDYNAKAATDMGVIKLKLAGTLDEVLVNTGYQSLNKEHSAGSFAKPDMNVIADRTGSMNLIQRLDGLVPGLVINNAPNTIYGKSAPFLIRGLTTIEANTNPLVVVDGIAMDVNDITAINPQDVADITVLKDATAAAIWGARAANGVIVVTTKKGKSGAMRITYDGFVNFQGRPQYDYFPVLNSAQFIQASRETFDPVRQPYSAVTTYNPNTGVSTGLTPDRQILYDIHRGVLTEAQGKAKLDSLSGLNNVGQIGELFYRPAMVMNHTLSIAGGSDKHTFYNSLAYTNNRSATPGSKDETFKINTRQDFAFNRFLKAYLIADLNYQSMSSKNHKAINNQFLPYQLFQDAAGKSLDINYMGYLSEHQRSSIESLSQIGLAYNPLEDMETGQGNSKNFTGRFNSGLTIDIIKGLRFEGVYGYVRGNYRTQQYFDHSNYQQRINVVNFAKKGADGNIVYHLPTTGGEYSVNNATMENWSVRNQLNYTMSWKDNQHQLSALLGQEAQEQITTVNTSRVHGYDQVLQTYAMLDYKTLSSTGVINPILPISGASSKLPVNSYFGELESVPRSRFTSYYANAGYTFARKYTLNASWRNDQSNLFGINKSAQRRPVWSVGLKWTLTQEPWMEKMKPMVNLLALRATYGITGNSPAPGFASSKDVLAATADPNAPGGSSLSISTLANPNLTWERTKNYNLGLDFGFLNNRINGSLEFYRKETSDLLGRLGINPLTGTTFINGNVGSLRNTGVELLLNTTNIERKDFFWSTMLTMSYNKNKVTDFGYLAAPITTGNALINSDYVKDYPAFSIFAYRYAGLDNAGDPQVHRADGTITKVRQDTKPEDISYMGVYQPVWSGGFSNLFRYRNFGFTINMVYNLGHVMFRDVNKTYTVSNNGSFIENQNFQSGNLHADFANRWQVAGDELKTDIPSFLSDAGANEARDLQYYIRADRNVLSASYIKIRDMAFSYQVPENMIKRIRLEGLSFRVQLSNIMLWKNNKDGIDPEFQIARYGVRTMPFNQNTVTIGAHLTF